MLFLYNISPSDILGLAKVVTDTVGKKLHMPFRNFFEYMR